MRGVTSPESVSTLCEGEITWYCRETKLNSLVFHPVGYLLYLLSCLPLFDVQEINSIIILIIIIAILLLLWLLCHLQNSPSLRCVSAANHLWKDQDVFWKNILWNRFCADLPLYCVYIYFLLFPRMSQSVWRHSTIVLTVTTNGMQELQPVMYLLLKFNHNWLLMITGIFAQTTARRIPLDEWSARPRDLYLTTHNTHNRHTSMPPVGFEPTISAGKRPQALDRVATGTGCVYMAVFLLLLYWFVCFCNVVFFFVLFCAAFVIGPTLLSLHVNQLDCMKLLWTRNTNFT